jgi:hypothetical protein
MHGPLHGQVALVTGGTRGAEALVQRIEHEQNGRLDVLVDDTWGATSGSSGNRSGSTTWTRACVRCATAWRHI